MATDKSHDVVKLATAANPVQAHVWQQALEEEGISCKVVGDFLDAGIGDLPGISPEIWVHRDELVRARDIIRAGEELEEKRAEQGEEQE
jgi:Putative prokaryotic signal transducing protein